MIYEWKPEDGAFRNFGDALTEPLLNLYPEIEREAMISSQTKMHFLVGSVISNEHMGRALDDGYIPVFHGCGWRGEALDKQLVSQAIFKGVRGFRTETALRSYGVDVEVVGDSAYRLLKTIKPYKLDTSVDVVVPHVGDFEQTPEGFELVSPKIYKVDDIYNVIDKLANAKFVLGGSMHACIVAHAYGVPFAPYGVEYFDCPPKWIDWLETIRVPWKMFTICKTLNEGIEWYSNVKPKLTRIS